jgi:hypothetical protein
MEQNNNTSLILALVDKEGNCISYKPDSFTNLGEWSKAEWDEFFKAAIENQEYRNFHEKNKYELDFQNSVKLKIILDTMVAAGMMKDTGIDATPFIKPYVDTIIAEYFSRKNQISRAEMVYQEKMDKLKAAGKSFFFPKMMSWGLKLIKKIL